VIKWVALAVLEGVTLDQDVGRVGIAFAAGSDENNTTF
jgi:hypothetical protein